MHQTRTVLALALTAALFGACYPVTGPEYAMTPSNQQSYPPHPPGCPFDVLRVVPSRPFVELGGLTSPGAAAWAQDDGSFRMAVGSTVCNSGGDAVIVHVDSDGAYRSGTVIRYLGGNPGYAQSYGPP